MRERREREAGEAKKEMTPIVGAELTRIESDHLWDLAYVQLRDALHAGRFEPGAVLSLRALAQSFGTSITPVRDAVTRLVTLGILGRGPRNAAVVPLLNVRDLKNLTLVRCAMESVAAREAAAKAEGAAIDALEAQLEEMRSLIRAEDFATYLDSHRRFHFKIYEMADNAVLSETIEILWLRCGPALNFVVPDYVRSLKGTDHHAAVLRAIRNGDSELAGSEIAADIEEAAAYLSGLADAEGRIQRPDASALRLAPRTRP